MSGAARAGLVGLLCFIWGSTWLVIKIGLADLPPFLAAGLRFTLAPLLLLALARARGVRFPRSRRAHLGLLGLGLTGFGISYGVVYWGEQVIPSGLTAVLFATHPLFVLLLAHGLIPDERITLRRASGVAIGFFGVVLIFGSDLQTVHPRAAGVAAIMLLSPLAAGAGNVAIKRWASRVHPFNLTILPMAYGAAALLLTSLATEDWGAARWSPVAIGSIAYLAVLGSAVAFVVYYTLLQQVAVTTLALLSYVYPVVAVALGYLVLGEVLGPRTLAGAACILAGIMIATWRRRRSPAPLPEAAVSPATAGQRPD